LFAIEPLKLHVSPLGPGTHLWVLTVCSMGYCWNLVAF